MQHLSPSKISRRQNRGCDYSLIALAIQIQKKKLSSHQDQRCAWVNRFPRAELNVFHFLLNGEIGRQYFF